MVGFVSCVGMRDPFSNGEAGSSLREDGPILGALASLPPMGRVVLVATQQTARGAEQTRTEILARHGSLGPSDVVAHILDVNDPTDYAALLLSFQALWRNVVTGQGCEQWNVVVNVATPQMQVAWIVLALCGRVKATLLNVKHDPTTRKSRLGLVDLPVLQRLLADVPGPSGRKGRASTDDTESWMSEPVEPVFQSRTMGACLERAGRYAAFDESVLILGPTGSGKEVVARFIHQASARAAGPFVPLSCANFTSDLLLSELFGCVPGAFTGAVKRSGFVQAAQGGTLFLDELAEAPLIVQGMLLRFLEEKRYTKVGSNTSESADVRFIAATNGDLAGAVTQGRFRADLYHRLDGCVIHIPPLVERPEDIECLIEHFAKRFATKHGCSGRFDDEAMTLLRNYPYPGNVRELKRTVETALMNAGGACVDPKALPDKILATPPRPWSPERPSVDATIDYEALLRESLTMADAARTMGIEPATFRKQLRTNHLDVYEAFKAKRRKP